jgi:DNA polymerase III epsilon subunit-like protein
MTIKDVLIFDTETTGLPEKKAKWDVDYMEFPHIVQLAWIHGCKEENHIIRPEGWEIPQETVEIHGITTEYALEHGEPFAAVVDMFIQDCHDAGLICGHNIYFDTSFVKANILRELGREYYEANDVESALHKGKRIDTMRATVKWVDARTPSGMKKWPKLEELYSRCFPGETYPAHDAMEDVKAVARCLPVIVGLGLVELKVKDYDAPKPENESTTAATIAAESAKKFGTGPEKAGNGQNINAKPQNDIITIQQTKTPQIEDFGKITDIAAALLEQNDF